MLKYSPNLRLFARDNTATKIFSKSKTPLYWLGSAKIFNLGLEGNETIGFPYYAPIIYWDTGSGVSTFQAIRKVKLVMTLPKFDSQNVSTPHVISPENRIFWTTLGETIDEPVVKPTGKVMTPYTFYPTLYPVQQITSLILEGNLGRWSAYHPSNHGCWAIVCECMTAPLNVDRKTE